jgi:hypothetical protein
MHHTRYSIQIVVAGFALISQTAKSQQTPSGPTLIIGTTPVKLGMPRDALIPVLSAQYIVRPQFPNCKNDSAVCRTYILFQNDNFPAGTLQFDRSLHLIKATVERLIGFQVHQEGEVGKSIVTTLSNFAAEGLRCSVGASSGNSYDAKNPNRSIPSLIFRQAIIECGDKRLRIISEKQEGYPEGCN